jgi:type II secretory pathway component GspD/PulD (secretin)
LFCFSAHNIACTAENTHDTASESVLANQFNEPNKNTNPDTKNLVDFVYQEIPLVDIITELAAKKGINIILPAGANTIEQKVSLQLDRRVTLDEAWEILIELLEMSGYAIVQHNQTYTVTKLSLNISSEPLPLYIGTIPKDLPDSYMRIRYIYYLANLKISSDNQSEVTDVITALLPDDAKVLTNQAANCIILVDTARNIKSVMEIVTSLDKTDFQETIEYLSLRYVPAKTVAELFTELLKTNKPTSRYRLDTKKSGSTFFSEYIRIVPEERTNSLREHSQADEAGFRRQG